MKEGLEVAALFLMFLHTSEINEDNWENPGWDNPVEDWWSPRADLNPLLAHAAEILASAEALS